MTRTLIKNAMIVTMDDQLGDELLALGAEVRKTSPHEAQAFVASEVARWTKVIREEKIQPQN
jgi:hypothetical protein